MKSKKKFIELLNKAIEIAYLEENLDSEQFDFENLGQTLEEIINEIEDIE
jgi:ATP-dependent exoDNAse (exonuclease V) alpha subunit